MNHINKIIAVAIFLGSSACLATPSATELMPLVVDQLGKFHPLVLHFPIVFVVLLPFMLIAAKFPWGRIWQPVIPWVIHLGSLSALVTATFGFASAEAFQPLDSHLVYHRNLALAATVCTLFNSCLLLIKRPDLSRKIPVALLISALVALACLTLGAHFGAEAIHGATFILFAN